MAPERLILGIDPGSINAGYALIKASGTKKLQIIQTGVCKLGAKEDFFKRLANLSEFFNQLTQPYDKFDLALETLIHVKNVNSLAKLAQARGAIIGALSTKSNMVCEYSPNLVKSTVSGYGFSSKKSVEKSLNFLFPKHEFDTHDESDALAIAICHSFHYSGDKRSTPKTNKPRSLKDVFKNYTETNKNGVS